MLLHASVRFHFHHSLLPFAVSTFISWNSPSNIILIPSQPHHCLDLDVLPHVHSLPPTRRNLRHHRPYRPARGLGHEQAGPPPLRLLLVRSHITHTTLSSIFRLRLVINSHRGYAITQIPGGILTTRFGAKVRSLSQNYPRFSSLSSTPALQNVLFISEFISLALTASFPFTIDFFPLAIASRFVLGLAHGPTMPAAAQCSSHSLINSIKFQLFLTYFRSLYVVPSRRETSRWKYQHGGHGHWPSCCAGRDWIHRHGLLSFPILSLIPLFL